MAKHTDLPIIEPLDIFLDDEDRADRAQIAAEMERQLKAVTFSKEFIESGNGVLAARDRVAKLEDQLTGRHEKMDVMQADLDELNEKMSVALENGDDAQVEEVMAEVHELEGAMGRLQSIMDMLESRTIPAAKTAQVEIFEEFKALARKEFSAIYERKDQQVRKAAEKINAESFAFMVAVEDVIKTLGLKVSGCAGEIAFLRPGEFTATPNIAQDGTPAPLESDYLGLGNQV